MEEQDDPNTSGEPKTRRRRLVQACDMQPANALMPVPPGTAPAAGSALEQLMQGVGLPAPHCVRRAEHRGERRLHLLK